MYRKGGNAPFIVFADADIDAVIDSLMMCKFRNSGQTCITANRVFVHARVYESVTKRLKERLDADVRMGVADGSEAGV